MHEIHEVSVVRSCTAIWLARSAYYQGPVDWQVRDEDVIEALNDLVEAHPSWEGWKYIARLRALGHPWKHKRIYQVYQQLRQNQPRRTKRRLPMRPSLPLFVPEASSEVWSADFMGLVSRHPFSHVQYHR